MSKKRHPVLGRPWAALPDLYKQIDMFEGPNGYRLRSLLARVVASGNPKVANGKYVGRIVRVQVIQAVRRG